MLVNNNVQHNKMPTDAGFAIGYPSTPHDESASDQIRVSWVIASWVRVIY
jgi:hypothetical protein